jgi:hypothetical protein
MTRIALFALVLSVGLPLPLWAQDVASLIAEDTLTWGLWEQGAPADKFARLRDLGVCYVEQSQSPADYRFVDFSGDGVTDVIYSGWNVDCDGAAGEGRATRFYHVQRDSARLVFHGLGIITDMTRPSPLAPVAFVLRYGGCCGDPRMFVAWYSATTESGSLRFAVADKIMYFRNLGHPTRYFERPRRFRVTNEIYNLRWTPQVDDESEDYFFDPEHRGNTLAQFQRDAGGVALGASPDSTGRVWWLVLMDPSSRPVSYVIDDNDDYNGGPPPRWLGWMSSRFLETVDTPGRDSGQREAVVVADSAALALVAEYLRRDAQGEFWGPSEWAHENVIGYMGGDFASIVSDYKILAAETRGDTTRVTVQYDVIGGSWLGEDLQPVRTLTDSVELHTFVVVRRKEGMRLDDPLPAIHVSGRVVLEQGIGLDEEYRRALEEVLRRKGVALPPDSTRETAAAAKSDARLLVEEYLRRDARGEFTGVSEWLAEVTSFDSAAYDPMTVVNSHEVLAEETTGDTTCITVQYGVRAGVKSDPNGPIWSFTDSVELHTFVVVRTERGLQLAGPALNPHISGRFVLEHLLFEEQHRRALEALRREGITPPARDSRQEVVVVANSTPLALVEEYLRRDARGEFAAVSDWLAEVAMFGLRGWDAMTVINGYEITATEATANTARITVQYDVIGGFVSAGPDGVPLWSLADSVEQQTFVVVRTGRGFRLSGPPLKPHLSARAVLERTLPDEYRRALEEALRRKSG